ncbi:hypothetical protein HPB48_011417 [Haemaphysalis longicornis]|uniref:Uncharacterized protein n=1 Tax=Haemaphysalis longicornis TaxID=44386 RepID=A0A9J6G944_HAELO|nr:hypothetical protein HPB48_011417 [Haemaphysalis longicornis]
MPDNFASSKKPRLEGKDGTLENETSPQVTGENEGVDTDNTPFTLVTYKKQRKQGIPVAFRPLNTTLNFWHVNPNRFASEIISTAKEKVQSFRVNKDGSFSVTVASISSAKHYYH